MAREHETGPFRTIDAEGVRTCAVHRETMNDIYAAIKEVAKGKVGWRYAALLCAIAGGFGVALWVWSSDRHNRNEEQVSVIRDRSIKMETDLEHIKAAQTEIKEEQKRARTENKADQERTRTEMLEGFKDLRELIKRAN
jgi:hypothetical protein